VRPESKRLGTEIEPLISTAGTVKLGETHHSLQLYESDELLAKSISAFFQPELMDDGVCLILATPDHRAAVETRLAAAGVELPTVRASGRYVELDAESLLERLLIDERVSPQRFSSEIEPVVARACAHGGEVRAFGELVSLLAASDNHDQALVLERLWNALQQNYRFSLLCGYSLDAVSGPELGHFMAAVCAEHSNTIPVEDMSGIEERLTRDEAVALLQQQASSLRQEIAHRQEIESELRRALAAEREARARAEEAIRTRDDFLVIAGHELRTPVATLALQAQVLKRWLSRGVSADEERVKEIVHGMSEQSQHIGRLVEHSLAAADLHANDRSFVPEPVDLVEVAERAADRANQLSHGASIRVESEGEVRTAVDVDRIELAMSNLLENALKYGPSEGEVTLSVTRPSEENVEIAVQDQGPGIEPEQREGMFERFYQPFPGDTRTGLGLGLFVCRQIAELHGGGVCADFPESGGMRVMITLPAAPEMEAQPVA